MEKDARGMKQGGSLEVKGEGQDWQFELGSKIKKQLSEALPVHGVESHSFKTHPIVIFTTWEEGWLPLTLKVNASKIENSWRVMRSNTETTVLFCYSSISWTSSVLGSD